MMIPKSYADVEIEYEEVVFEANVKTDTREYPDAFVPPTENGIAPKDSAINYMPKERSSLGIFYDMIRYPPDYHMRLKGNRMII